MHTYYNGTCNKSDSTISYIIRERTCVSSKVLKHYCTVYLHVQFPQLPNGFFVFCSTVFSTSRKRFMRGWERFSWSDEAKGYNGNISSNFKNRHTISNHFINRTLEWIQPLINQKIPLKSSHWVEHEVHKINYRSHFLVLIRILYGEYFSQSCDHFRSLHALFRIPT